MIEVTVKREGDHDWLDDQKRAKTDKKKMKKGLRGKWKGKSLDADFVWFSFLSIDLCGTYFSASFFHMKKRHKKWGENDAEWIQVCIWTSRGRQDWKWLKERRVQPDVCRVSRDRMDMMERYVGICWSGSLSSWCIPGTFLFHPLQFSLFRLGKLRRYHNQTQVNHEKWANLHHHQHDPGIDVWIGYVFRQTIQWSIHGGKKNHVRKIRTFQVKNQRVRWWWHGMIRRREDVMFIRQNFAWANSRSRVENVVAASFPSCFCFIELLFLLSSLTQSNSTQSESHEEQQIPGDSLLS